MIRSERIRRYVERRQRSVFGPFEQRVYGLIQVAQGVVTMVVGKYGPSWTLKYAMWGATRRNRKTRLSDD